MSAIILTFLMAKKQSPQMDGKDADVAAVVSEEDTVLTAITMISLMVLMDLVILVLMVLIMVLVLTMVPDHVDLVVVRVGNLASTFLLWMKVPLAKRSRTLRRPKPIWKPHVPLETCKRSSPVSSPSSRLNARRSKESGRSYPRTRRKSANA